MNNFLQARQYIDLSVTLENNPYTDPPHLLPKIEYTDHQQGWPEMSAMFPGLELDDLPGNEAWAAEWLTMTTHGGTHMDSPWHYASTTDGGKPAYGIDELPLDWCLRPGVKLDCRDYEDGYILQVDDIKQKLKQIDYQLQALDIVLINTSAGACFGQPEYLSKGCGVGRAATLWLLEQGVRVVGIDAWSWDAPFQYTRERYAKSKDASIIWEGHKAGRDIGYGQMEKLTNLEQLPDFGFMVSCFPYKIKHASAGFVRAVAIL